MNAKDIIDKYINFFKKRDHKQIANASLVPENDPTTLFTSSGMQPLVPYLLGEPHPSGKRLVNVQNSFRAQDIEEIGDNRHTTFFRMLGNWSLGDYFKKEEIPWLWEFLTSELGLPKEKLYITVFEGFENIEKDNESYQIWKKLVPTERIFFAGVDKNWWSRSGVPDNMPLGEPGGPDTEVYFRFDDLEHNKKCKDNPVDCECGKFLEIANSVFMQYVRKEKGFEQLPKQNVDFGGGLERLLAAVENKSDMFQTSLFSSIVDTIELLTHKNYKKHSKSIRIVIDHFIASVFIINSGVSPSNKDQGYVLRRLIRRGLDNYQTLLISRHSGDQAKPETPESLITKTIAIGDSGQARMTIGNDIVPVLESIVEQYKQTDPDLSSNFENIKNTILEEKDAYETALKKAKSYIFKKYQTTGDDLKGKVEISSDDAFFLYSSHGLSPTQILNLGYVFNEQEFAKKMEEHQKISRAGSAKKFAGGLADHQEKTIMGHTATHLLHQALRDVLGNHVFQSGSNITSERVRFDFNFERNLTTDEIKKVEEIVNEKINDNLKVHFEMMPLTNAIKIGAIGLFDDKYSDMVKVYFIGPSTSSGRSDSDESSDSKRRPPTLAYSVEFCGGPHVDFTSRLKRFKIIKQENLGRGQKRLYAIVGK